MLLDDIMKIALNRGIFFPTAEVYNPIGGFYEWGPIGSQIRRNLIEAWREFFVDLDETVYEIHGSTILPYEVLKASGHVDKFVDPQVTCTKCGEAFRADHLIENATGENVEGWDETQLNQKIAELELKCPKCKGDLGAVTVVNTMFPVKVGIGKEARAFLRPETAQNIFIAFPRVTRAVRARPPFGIAQVGTSYRNEISPRRGLFRVREFEQLEIEYFVLKREDCDSTKSVPCKHWEECTFHNFAPLEPYLDVELNLYTVALQENPNNTTEYETHSIREALDNGILPNHVMAYFLAKEQLFLERVGISKDKIRFREMLDSERPFYSASNFDCEIKYSFGWKEVIGNAYRTNHDLSTHGKATNNMKAFRVKQPDHEPVPHVVEPSFGVGRLIYAILEESYREPTDREYAWFAFPSIVAPFKCAVFPLRKDFSDKAKKIQEELIKKLKIRVLFDNGGSIGKRYARADEIGIPYCITIDYDTFEDETVTIRDRDSKDQIRASITELHELLQRFWDDHAHFEEELKIRGSARSTSTTK